MKTTKLGAGLRIAGLFAALGALGACGGVVVIDGPQRASGGSGAGGAGGASPTGDPGTTSTGEPDPTGGTGGSVLPGDDCTIACSIPSDGVTCACTRTCNSDTFDKGTLKISCTVDDFGKDQCICMIPSAPFAGACYEKHDAACSFDQGCCAKYFTGK